MRSCVFASLLQAAAGVARSSAAWSADAAPAAWSVRGKAAAEHRMEFLVGLQQQNLGELESILMAVSDPSSARYGQHLSAAGVQELTAPRAEDVSSVLSFLEQHGLNGTAKAGGSFVAFSATVAEAQRLLNAEYYELEDAEGRRAVRTPSYSLPDHLSSVVEVLEPTLRLPGPSARAFRLSSEAGAKKTTPESLRSLYSVEGAGSAGSGNVQATANFLDQYFKPSDLQQFLETYAPSAQRPVQKVLGPNDASKPGVEAELDIEFIMGVGAGLDTWFWSTAGQVGENEPFLAWLSDVAAADKVPQLFSISYADYEDTVDPSYAKRVSDEFMKAGARGITIISGSGDGGVEGAQPRTCPGGKFVPTFPCASPYETCVGGTTGGYAAGDTETAVSFSGGGFSNNFGVASYQASAVAAWQKTAQSTGKLPEAGLFNASGRGFPDVAAMGTDFQVVLNGKTISVGGTSASTPTLAGVVALLNEKRIQAGRPPLGFLNPLLYAHPEAFQDITAGSNPGCGQPGFFAEKGWDPITGLGTPNFKALAKLVEGLPEAVVV